MYLTCWITCSWPVCSVICVFMKDISSFHRSNLGGKMPLLEWQPCCHGQWTIAGQDLVHSVCAASNRLSLGSTVLVMMGPKMVESAGKQLTFLSFFSFSLGLKASHCYPLLIQRVCALIPSLHQLQITSFYHCQGDRTRTVQTKEQYRPVLLNYDQFFSLGVASNQQLNISK